MLIKYLLYQHQADDIKWSSWKRFKRKVLKKNLKVERSQFIHGLERHRLPNDFFQDHLPNGFFQDH